MDTVIENAGRKAGSLLAALAGRERCGLCLMCLLAVLTGCATGPFAERVRASGYVPLLAVEGMRPGQIWVLEADQMRYLTDLQVAVATDDVGRGTPYSLDSSERAESGLARALALRVATDHWAHAGERWTYPGELLFVIDSRVESPTALSGLFELLLENGVERIEILSEGGLVEDEADLTRLSAAAHLLAYDDPLVEDRAIAITHVLRVPVTCHFILDEHADAIRVASIVKWYLPAASADPPNRSTLVVRVEDPVVVAFKGMRVRELLYR